jgi:hypothetical protein
MQLIVADVAEKDAVKDYSQSFNAATTFKLQPDIFRVAAFTTRQVSSEIII